MKIRSVLAAAAALMSMSSLVQAQDAGDWIVRLGVHTVQPKSDNHPLVNVDDAASLTFSGTFMVTPRFGVELLAALPFEHDVDLNSGGKIASVKHLPPTLSAQYHFNPNGRVRPYVGAGLNYTLFFDESTTGALRGSKLHLDDSFGLAAQAGVDVNIAADWALALDVRYIDIDSDVKLNGATDLGTVEIDPYAIALSVAKRF